MTLKGKNKFLCSIIVCLVAVAFVAGIAGVVYSQNNASVKVEFKGDTWNTNKEFGQKQWFMNANENEVKFIVDLSDYKMERLRVLKLSRQKKGFKITQPRSAINFASIGVQIIKNIETCILEFKAKYNIHK